MTLTRREFVELGLASTVGGSALLTLEGCNPTDVWHNIEAWVPVGIDAFDSIIAIVDPVMTPAIDAIAALVKAGFASLAAAIDSYLNAPAADKATWAQRVKLILTAIGANLQNFLTAIGQSANPLVKVVGALIQVIVDTIAGFINQILPSAASAFPKQFKVGDTVIVVNPTTRTRKQFVQIFNNTCDSINRPDLYIPRQTPLAKWR